VTDRAIPPRTLSITFQYTIDDLREAAQLPPSDEEMKALISGKSKPRRQMGRGIIGWVLFIALATMLFMLLMKTNSRRGSPLADDPYDIDFWLTIAPSAIGTCCIGMLVAAIAIVSRLSRRQRLANQKDTSGVFFAGAFLAMLAVLVGGSYCVVHPPIDIQWELTRFQVALLTAGPWVAVLIGSMALVILLQRSGIRHQFESTPAFRRARSVQISDDGIRSEDGVSSTVYTWPHYRRAWETLNLLVLQDENSNRHILPKRAVVGEEQLELARSLIASRVEDSRFLVKPRGFPVVPMPVLPVEAGGGPAQAP
jgi:hypothetical protein